MAGLPRSHHPVEYASAILNVLVLGTSFFCFLLVRHRTLRGMKVAAALSGFLLLLLLPLSAGAAVLMEYWGWLSFVPASLSIGGAWPLPLLLGIVLLLGIAFLLHRHGRRAARGAYLFLLVLFPFVPVTFTHAAWRALAGERAPLLDQATASEPQQKTQPRVVWIVFDEWDQRLTFEERPTDLELPQLERLRSEAFYATQAYAPAEQTLISMLSLLAGRVVQRVAPAEPGDFQLVFRDLPETSRWSNQPNLFSRLRKAGLTSAVVGWHVPYCSLLRENVTFCWTSDAARQASFRDYPIPRLMSDQWQALVKRAVFSISSQSLAAVHHSQLYAQMMEQARRVVADGDLDLVLVHLPIPHSPHFYDRASGSLRSDAGQPTDYFDSLALLDRTLGDLRYELEQAGLWEATSVLISSDHWLRASEAIDGKKDHRVPFLLRLVAQDRGVTYNRPFNTVLSHDLVVALSANELHDWGEMTRWMDQRRGLVDTHPVYSETRPEANLRGPVPIPRHRFLNK